jgi:hypothetical protein
MRAAASQVRRAMKLIVMFASPGPPIDLRDPQCAKVLFDLVYDMTERVGPFAEFEGIVDLGGFKAHQAYRERAARRPEGAGAVSVTEFSRACTQRR